MFHVHVTGFAGFNGFDDYCAYFAFIYFSWGRLACENSRLTRNTMFAVVASPLSKQFDILLVPYYSGRRRRVLKWARLFFSFFRLGLPILHFGRWLVRGTFAVCSSHVRPVNRNKWRRAIWNAMTYKRIRLLPYFLPCGVHKFSLVCLYFIGNFRPTVFTD